MGWILGAFRWHGVRPFNTDQCPDEVSAWPDEVRMHADEVSAWPDEVGPNRALR
jgi:hypothetical protein